MRNHDLRTLPTHKHLRAFTGVFLGLVCAFQVNAQSVSSDAAFGRFMTNVVGSGQQTVNFATNGQATLTTASGRLAMSAEGTTSIVGKPLPVVVKASPIMGPLVKGILATTKVFGPVGLGLAAWQLYSEMTDFVVTQRPDKTLDIQKKISGINCLSDCFEYRLDSSGPFFPSLVEANSYAYSKWVQTRSDMWNPTGRNWSTANNGCDAHICMWGFYLDGNFQGNTGAAIQKRPIPPYSTASYAPATEQELVDAIANKSGWPSTSNLAKAAKVAIDQGYEPQLQEETKTITGPATTSPKVTTKLNPDGTTETTTEKSNITYQGNTITVSNISTVNNSNPVTNIETTTTTTTENPDQPLDLCEKNPDALACQKPELDIPDDEIPTLEKNITFEPVDLGLSGGTCPPNIVKTYSGNTVTVFDWASSCDKITTYAKPAILLMALFTAMGIIFIGVPVK